MIRWAKTGAFPTWIGRAVMNGVHDMGGMDGFGKVEVEANEPAFHEPWEGRVMAMVRAMGANAGFNIDMHRDRCLPHFHAPRHEANHIADLRSEITHTERYALRQELKHDEELLRSLLARLPAPGVAAVPAG